MAETTIDPSIKPVSIGPAGGASAVWGAGV